MSQITVASSGSGPVSGVETLTGNIGGPVSPVANNINVVTANSTVVFSGATPTLTLDFGPRNIFFGVVPPLTVGDENTALGFNAGGLIADGVANVIIGFEAGANLTNAVANVIIGDSAMTASGANTDENVAIGYGSMLNFSGSSGNVAVGFQSLNQLGGGSNNLALGVDAGSNYNAFESDNILLLNNGQNGENGVTRIGTNGNQTMCFIAGIDAVDLSTANVVTEVSDQLGTAVLTAGTGISITPGAGVITIDNTLAGGPAFMASLTATDAGVTGDGTQYQIAFDTVVFDVGSNFTGGTTFTAPVTGHYFFTATHHCAGLTALNTFSFFQIITTGVDYELLLDSPFANSTGGELVRTGNAFVPMTAGDTAYLNLQIQGEVTRNVSLVGLTATSNQTTMFAGYQVA